MSLDCASKSERVHTINQLLKAYTLFSVEYVVIAQSEDRGRADRARDGGQALLGGLHQAIEAKERVQVEAAT